MIAQGVDPLGAPNPLDVVPTIDDARRAAAIVGPEGGALEATGSDGIRFTLTIPPDALVISTPIEMTPVASIEGLPFDQLAGAVELEPDGLWFVSPATLVIEPSGPSQIERERVFGYRAGGRDLHLEPIDPTATAVTIPVMHFSALGLAYGTREQVAALAARTPFDAETAIQNTIARLTAIERSRILVGELDDEAGAFREQAPLGMSALWTTVLEPLLQRAISDATYFEAAYVRHLQFQRQLQLLGLEEEFATEVATGDRLIRLALPKAMEGIYDRCERDRTLVNILIATYRTGAAQVLGMPELADFGRMVACVHFELVYSATTTEDTYDGVQRFTAQTQTTMPIRFVRSHFGWKLEGQAAVNYTDYTMQVSFAGSTCEDAYSVEAGASMEATVGVFMDFFQAYQQVDKRPRVTIELFPGNPEEQYTGRCPGNDSSFRVWAYSQPFWKVHEGERTRGTPKTGQDEIGNRVFPWEDEKQLYVIRDWEGVGAAGIVARKRYEATAVNHIPAQRGTATVTESSLFELFY